MTLDGTSMYVVCSRQFSLYHEANCLLIICGVVSFVADWYCDCANLISL